MTHSPSVLILQGPNLDQLGQREPDLYGRQTLAEIHALLETKAKELNLSVTCFQSNHEGELLEAIHGAVETTRGLIINPAGLTHTSVVLRDALAAYPHPKVEVHLSNIYQREEFRHYSYVSAVVGGVISGLGAQGYCFALEAVASQLNKAE